ncbi:MAG: hypothetical protein FWE45_02465 [Firmicutes bacterium]|nr:hypothetical protein [Bacillota bacterium]
MDLKSFSHGDPYAPYRDEAILKEENQADNTNMNEQDIRQAIGKFSSMSNDQLMMELAKQIGMQKDKGNANSIRETIEKIKPLLNAEQQKKLQHIIGTLDI